MNCFSCLLCLVIFTPIEALVLRCVSCLFIFNVVALHVVVGQCIMLKVIDRAGVIMIQLPGIKSVLMSENLKLRHWEVGSTFVTD